MDGYRGTLNEDILNSQNYRISVFLIPKIINHLKSSDLAIEFINVDKLSDEKRMQYDNAIGFLKGIEFPFKFRPKRVVEAIKIVYPKFNMNDHTNCWKKYNARPRGIIKNFRSEYSAYVDGYDSYLYSQKWIDFLLDKLSKEK
ncbi:hypothetical protein ACWA5Z_01185 [Testudinibacter sp. P80/BLE/0925]|uniref:hypothetical protein n=1 Tax=Testudinibacter sp. TW-1 TaxID=3417757 RepID=UPI003D35BF69